MPRFDPRTLVLIERAQALEQFARRLADDPLYPGRRHTVRQQEREIELRSRSTRKCSIGSRWPGDCWLRRAVRMLARGRDVSVGHRTQHQFDTECRLRPYGCIQDDLPHLAAHLARDLNVPESYLVLRGLEDYVRARKSDLCHPFGQ